MGVYGGLWREIWRNLWEEVVCDGAGDYCALFMMVAIGGGVRVGSSPGLRERKEAPVVGTIIIDLSLRIFADNTKKRWRQRTLQPLLDPG